MAGPERPPVSIAASESRFSPASFSMPAPWQSKQRRTSTGRIRVSKNAVSSRDTAGGAAQAVPSQLVKTTSDNQIRMQPIYSNPKPQGMLAPIGLAFLR
jgi:hypothetical protein